MTLVSNPLNLAQAGIEVISQQKCHSEGSQSDLKNLGEFGRLKPMRKQCSMAASIRARSALYRVLNHMTEGGRRAAMLRREILPSPEATAGCAHPWLENLASLQNPKASTTAHPASPNRQNRIKLPTLPQETPARFVAIAEK